MLNVSKKAAAALHETLQENEEDSSNVLRLALIEGGLGLSIDEEREGDQIVRHEDRTVLAIEPELAREMDGATIDLVETPEGRRLVFQPPEP